MLAFATTASTDLQSGQLTAYGLVTHHNRHVRYPTSLPTSVLLLRPQAGPRHPAPPSSSLTSTIPPLPLHPAPPLLHTSSRESRSLPRTHHNPHHGTRDLLYANPDYPHHQAVHPLRRSRRPPPLLHLLTDYTRHETPELQCPLGWVRGVVEWGLGEEDHRGCA